MAIDDQHPPIDDAFWDRVPYLRTLSLDAPGLFATLRHDRLEQLSLSGPHPFRIHAPWQAPRLARLRWHHAQHGVEVLWRSTLPGLRELDLLPGVMPLFDQPPFLELVKQLEALAIPRSAIHGNNQTAAGMLNARAGQLAHLRSLVVYSSRGLPDQSILRRLPNLRWGG